MCFGGGLHLDSFTSTVEVITLRQSEIFPPSITMNHSKINRLLQSDSEIISDSRNGRASTVEVSPFATLRKWMRRVRLVDSTLPGHSVFGHHVRTNRCNSLFLNIPMRLVSDICPIRSVQRTVQALGRLATVATIEFKPFELSAA